MIDRVGSRRAVRARRAPVTLLGVLLALLMLGPCPWHPGHEGARLPAAAPAAYLPPVVGSRAQAAAPSHDAHGHGCCHGALAPLAGPRHRAAARGGDTAAAVFVFGPRSARGAAERARPPCDHARPCLVALMVSRR